LVQFNWKVTAKELGDGGVIGLNWLVWVFAGV